MFKNSELCHDIFNYKIKQGKKIHNRVPRTRLSEEMTRI